MYRLERYLFKARYHIYYVHERLDIVNSYLNLFHITKAKNHVWKHPPEVSDHFKREYFLCKCNSQVSPFI